MLLVDRCCRLVALAAVLVAVALCAGALPAHAAARLPTDLAASPLVGGVNPDPTPAARFAVTEALAGGAASFADVGEGNPFYSEISWLSRAAVSTGYPDGTYRPLAPVNRDAMAAFMYRLAGKPEYVPPAASPFADVTPSTQFYKEIAWLAAQGISTGWTESNGSRTYRPLQAVNRDAMAAFMYRLASKPQYAPPATGRFRDVPAGTQFFMEINWFAEAGISTGYEDQTYRPVQSVNRDAMAAFMYRFVGRPQAVGAGAPGTVNVGPLAAGHASALIRLSVPAQAAAAVVSVAGGPVLSVPAGSAISTAVLAPLNGTAIEVTATAQAAVKAELLATFDGDPAVPGSTIALDRPVTRADTANGLAGAALTTTPVTIGLTGAGGVPSTGVRALYVTATVHTDRPANMMIGGQSFPVRAGDSSLTTILSPEADGTVEASFDQGAGTLRLDVRGYVPDAVQDANSVNVAGSFVPAARPQSSEAPVAAGANVPLTVPGPRDRDYSLALVSASASSAPGRLGVGAARGGEITVDPGIGAGPQLAVIPSSDATLRLSAGATTATVLPIGDILSATAAGALTAGSVRIASPSNGANIDLSTTGSIDLSGTIEASPISTKNVTVSVGNVVVGAAAVRQTHAGTSWSFRTGIPQSGTTVFTVTATDRSGATNTATLSVTATLPAPTAAIPAPDAVVLDPANAALAPAAADATSVLFTREPAVQPGDVIVSLPSQAAPEGLLRKVMTVDRTANGWVAQTEPAAITDAIHQAHVDQTLPLTTAQVAVSTGEPPAPGDTTGVQVLGAGPSVVMASGENVDLAPYPTSGASQTLSGAVQRLSPERAVPESIGVDNTYDTTIAMAAKFAFETSGSKADYSTADVATAAATKAAIAASGGVTAEAKSQIGVEVHFRLMISPHFNWGIPSVKVDDFSVILSTDAKTEVTADAFLKVATTEALKKKIATLKLPILPFMVGPVPVVISNTGIIHFESKFSAEVAIHVEAKIQRTQDFGFRYTTDTGLKNATTEPVTTITDPVFGAGSGAAITGKIEASMGPTLDLTSKIYDMAGPVFSLGSQIGATGKITLTATGATVETETFLEGSIKVGVKLTAPIVDKAILDATLIDITRRWKLGSWSRDYTTAFPGTPLPGPPPDPTPNPRNENGTITTIAQGLGTGYASRKDGTAWSWGLNDYGQLGDGTVTEWSQPHPMTPKQIPGISDVKAVAAGTYTGYALKNDGTVWGWGSNINGSIGDGTTTPRSSPVQLAGLTGVTSLSVLGENGYALKSDGTVSCWGDNRYGQLGDTQNFHATPEPIPGLSNITSIAAGNGFVLALSNGKVLMSGYELGRTPGVSYGVKTLQNLPAIRSIAAGETAYALATDGSIWAWGQNSSGQLGDGTTTSRTTPKQVSGLDNVLSIAASSFSTGSGYALRTDGTVWAWGANLYGNLGDGTTFDRAAPVQVLGLDDVSAIVGGQANAFAVKKDGSLWGWGANGHNDAMMVPGALGDRTATNRLTPVPLSDAWGAPQTIGFKDIEAGPHTTLGLTTEGKLYGWGSNWSGEIGDGTREDKLTPVPVAGLPTIKQMSMGGNHGLAVTGDGQVFAWGYNGNGRLGDGTDTDRFTPVHINAPPNVIQVAAGGAHSLAITSDGKVYAWGFNTYGQLGNGTTDDQLTPRLVPGLNNVADVAANDFHSMAVTTTGDVYTWGRGILGNGNTENIHNPVKVEGLSNVVGVAAGSNHSLAVDRTGHVFGWGENSYGETGNGSSGYLQVQIRPALVPELSGIIDVQAGQSHSVALTTDGSVFAWGSNWKGEMGNGRTYPSQPTPVPVGTLSGVTDIAAAGYFTIALQGNLTAYGWGSNVFGQLGTGNKTDASAPVPMPSTIFP